VARAPAVQSENLDLAALAATFVRLLAPLAGRQGAQVVLDAANETRVRADASRLEQILFNLATNALQAGARLIEVRVTADPASVTVRDDGPGVDAAVRERLFEPFVTSKPAGQGTGLGLAICKRLAEEMNGHLTLLTSRPGETVFQLQLPALEET
jgi:signal transduction histidine kinase